MNGLERKALEVHTRLDERAPKHIEFLDAARMGAYELLIATILSAQTTDRQVNSITPQLFETFPLPEDLAQADIAAVEQIIRPTGFFHVKARNIQEAAAVLVERFHSRVPESLEKLTSLPGVGRKTASVIRGHIFSLPAIIVDTHFSRVVRRIGLTQGRHADAIEREVADLLPESCHYRFSMTINYHGRMICHAKKPECGICMLGDICISADAFAQRS
jgi:endonuclease-3